MVEVTITGWDTRDVRFPTSLDKTGSDAMNAAGDYSAAYCILKTDSEFSGHGMVYQHPTTHNSSGNASYLVNSADLDLLADLYDRSRKRYCLQGN